MNIFNALKSAVPFGAWGGWGNGATYNGRPVEERWYTASPGAKYDYREAAGEPWANGVVAACVDAIGQALASAPPVLQQREANEWQPVEKHPLLDLLQFPNDSYSSAHLWSATAGSECVTGNGFWRLVWDRNHTRPVEAWWEAALSPRYDATHFISDYQLLVDGVSYYLPPDEVIHFRHALHPLNPRLGFSPLQTVLRQIAGDNSAATYHGALLRNAAVASLMVSIKGFPEGMPPPSVAQIEEFIGKLERKLTGEGAGRVAGTNMAVTVDRLGYSPEEMALDKLVSYYESRICAALRVPPMLIGLSAGDDTKTYSNYGEAVRDFWTRTIIPMQERHGAELGAQLLPLYGLDPARFRIGWDRSQVAALREDEEALYQRLEAACGGPFLTPNEARAKAKLAAVAGGDDLRGVHGGGAHAAGVAHGDDNAMKYDPHQPRDKCGRWTRGGSGAPMPQIVHDASTITDPADAKNFDRVAALVDAVNGSRQAPPAKVRTESDLKVNGDPAYGSFHPKEGVAVDEKCPHKASTLCHELGHHFDYSAITPNRYASLQSEIPKTPLHAWRLMIETSFAVMSLREELANEKDEAVRKYLDYLLDPRELFARSYEQYVAIKTQDAELLSQLRTKQGRAGVSGMSYWNNSEFVAIAAEFDRLMGGKG